MKRHALVDDSRAKASADDANPAVAAERRRGATPPASNLRTALARLTGAFTHVEEQIASLVGDPRRRWPAALVMSGFVLYTAFAIKLQAYLPREYQTYGRKGHRLEATGVTATGERVVLPVYDEIFRYSLGLSTSRSFEQYWWLWDVWVEGEERPPEVMIRQRAVAEYFHDRAAAWGVELVEVTLRARVVTDGGEIDSPELGTFPMPPPANRRTPR